MANQSFDDLTDIYDSMIDWPKRLAHEEPFYRRLFEPLGVRRVLDAACGTGHHAAMFHGWGLEVEGADISPQMIGRARARFGEPPGLRWTVRGFDEPAGDSSFDAAVCVGNSLALAGDMEVVRRAIQAMLAAVRPGGLLVVQVLNLWRMADGPCLWQKSLRVGEVHILKGLHRCGSRGYVDLVVADAANGALRQNESVFFLGLEAGDLEQMAREAGAREVTIVGGYRGESYDRSTSVDLTLVAHK